jgi:hypothetical protein
MGALETAQSFANPLEFLGIDTGVQVPGRIRPEDRSGSLNPLVIAAEARAAQERDLGQELFTAPLLGRVTPAGIGRLVVDPLNIVPLPIGLVGKAAKATPGSERVGRELAARSGALFGRETLLGQTLTGVTGIPELFRVVGKGLAAGPRGVTAAVGRKVRGRPDVDRESFKVLDKNATPEAHLRANPDFLRTDNVQDIANELSMKQRVSLLGRLPVLGDQIQGSFNRLRGRLPDNADPDLVGAVIYEGVQKAVDAENLTAFASTQFGEAMQAAKFKTDAYGRITVQLKNSAEADGFLRKQLEADTAAYRAALARWKKQGETWRGRLRRGPEPQKPQAYTEAEVVGGRQATGKPVGPWKKRTYTFENYGAMREALEHVDVQGPGGLTQAQRNAIDIGDGWVAFANDVLLATGADRKLLYSNLGKYFPRRVIGKDTGEELLRFGDVQMNRSGQVVSSKAGASRPRTFESASDAVAAGYQLENDPARVLATYMRGTLHEAIDRHVERLAAELPGAAAAKTPGVAQGKFRKTVLGADETKRLTRAFEDPAEWTGPVGVAMRGLQRFNQVAVPLMTTLDISGTMIQGGMSLFSHPVAWLRAVGIATASLANPAIYRNYLDNKAELMVRGQKNGLVFLSSHDASEFLFRPPAALRRVAGQDNVLGKATRKSAFLPKMANLHFSRFGNVLRAELWEGVEQTALATGREYTERESRDLAGVLNNMTGVGVKGFGQGGGALIFAPRFFRSQLDLIDKAIADGTVAGDMARENISRYFVLGAMFTKFTNDANGEETVWDPTDPNFMRIRGLGRDISVFGAYDTLFRALAKVPEDGFGAAAQLAESKASPAIGRMLDVMKGYNWDGKAIKFDNLDNIASSFELLAAEQAPIGITNIYEETQAGVQAGLSRGALAAGALSEFVGTKSAPLSVGDRFDKIKDEGARLVGERYGVSVPDYDALVRREGNYGANALLGELNYAPLLALEAESTVEQAARARSGALSDMGLYFLEQGEIKARKVAKELALQEELQAGRITGKTYRQRMGDVGHDARVEYAQLARGHAGVIEQFEESPHPVDQAVSEYLSLYEQAKTPSGHLDRPLLDALQDGFRLKHGVDIERRVEGAILDRKEDTPEGEKLRLAQELLAPLFQMKERLFRAAREDEPALQQYQSLAHLEAVIRNQAMEADPYNPDRIEAILRQRTPILRRIAVVDERFKRRMRNNPAVLRALNKYYS